MVFEKREKSVRKPCRVYTGASGARLRDTWDATWMVSVCIFGFKVMVLSFWEKKSRKDTDAT